MIHFIRHGQTDANLDRINAGGEYDIPLNVAGVAQARAFSESHQEFIAELDAVFVSPMLRARQTADLILSGHKTPVEIIEDLREIRLGKWSAASYQMTGDYFTEQRDPPGGESWTDFHRRAIRGLRQAAESHKGKLLVVAHGGIWFSYAWQSGHSETHLANCTRRDIGRVELEGIIS